MKHLGKSRGKDLWRLKDGREFRGTQAQAENLDKGLEVKVKEVPNAPEWPENLTKKELVTLLDNAGVEYEANANKATLVEIVKENLEEGGGQTDT